MTELTTLDLQDGTKRLAMMIEVAALDNPSTSTRPSSSKPDQS